MAGALAPRPSAGPATVAFHYAAVFTPEESEWYTRFSVLVTGAVLAAGQTKVLRQNGTKLIAYEWSSGFYPADPSSADLSWQATVQRRRKDWLLNLEPVSGAAAERPAMWYDFGNQELRAERVRYLAGLLKQSGYDGFFFDTLGAEQLTPGLRNGFLERHPGLDYNRCQGLFLRELRLALPLGKLIFTNQGYRHADLLLPHADFDLSESYFTYVKPNGSTGFRKLWDAKAPWESVTVPVSQLIVPALRTNPAVTFVHLNYAAGSKSEILRAARYSYACARLWNHLSYLVSPPISDGERDEIYFADLGSPTGESYQEDQESSVAWRVFEKGVVAVNSGTRGAVIPSLKLKLPDPPRGYLFRT